MIQSNGSKFTVWVAILLIGVSGCRFGNYADEAKPIKNPDYYKSIELFFTTPKTFQTKVVLNSLGGPDSVINTNSAAPMTAIPTQILNTFSDPVYFAVPNDTRKLPLFRDISDSTGMETILDADGKIALDYIPSSGPFILWDNPNCITNYQILHEGEFNRTQPGSVIYPDGSTVPVAGSLKFSYTFSRVIESVNGVDNCAADLNRLAFCYQDGTGCSASELSGARTLFDLYVRQTGVLRIEDASKLKALEYRVDFE